MEFIANQYLHGKTMLAIGAGRQLFDSAESLINVSSIKGTSGILLATNYTIDDAGKLFIEALSKHRHPIR